MGEIIIKHRAGGETKLQNKQATVKITKAEQRKQLLGEDTFNITIQSAQPIEIVIGDRIEIFGSVYTINQLPTIKKTGTRVFEQTIILEGTQYELIDVQFILPGNTMYDNLTGDLDDFIDVLIQNANRIYPSTWIKGLTPTGTETKTLSFSERNCLEALQTLCEEYSTEFEIVVSTTGTRTLHIKQVGLQFPFPFTYGRTGGLYQLTRQNVNSQSVVTRLYVYGGRNNLGNTYRNSKLCLPGKLKNDSYIEDEIAVGLYGVKENTKTFDKIFPARYGAVTSLGEETFSFHDTTMDFDLNETEPDPGAPAPEEGEEPVTRTKWLIPGISAKVRFTTGNLAGYEFDVHSYDHTTKEIQIVPFTDESGYKFPSETSSAFQIAIGDVYHFTDINLPLAYITEAEEKLETEGEKHYNKYSQPQVQYALSIHPRFLEKYAGAPETISNIFALGDQIQVIDDDIGVDKSLRITGFTRDALDPYRYILTLSEAAYNKTIINRIISDIEDITDIIEINNLGDPYKARRNWMAAQELLNKIFDPEGYYYSEKIRPLSIETMMLQVGAKSQQFILQNTRFEPNHQGDPNAINIIGGQLVHYTLNDTITTWNLTSTTVTQLDPAKSYFVYAKCQADGDAGVVIIDDTQIKVDQDPMFYHFIIGHLSSVITNPDGSNPARILSLTYGSTTINGRFIKTGRIESSGGGSTYFDLDEGVISGNIRFISNGVETDLSTWADQMLAELEDVDGVITDLEEYIDGAFADGIISEAEARAIEKYINQINKEKNELEVVYNKTYLNPLLTGTPKTNLLNAKITLFGDITSLLNTINTAIADGAATPAEKQAVDAAFTTYSSSIDLFTTRLEEARISIEQYLKGEADGARAAAAAAEAAANAASQDVADISGIIDALDTYIDGAFHDGVIEEAEAKSIETYINKILTEKASLEATYNKLYTNQFLTGTPKTNLLNAKVTYFGEVDNLIATINAVISDGKVTPSEKQSVDAVFASYRVDMALLSTRIEEANQSIQNYLKSHADAIDAKVNIAKAITDKFGTSINGGLISSVIMLLREATPQDGTSNEDPGINTAGISGIQGAAKDQPALWAGGTYADAVAGIAKAIIRHNGKIKATDVDLTGVINAISGTIANLIIKDSKLKTPDQRLEIDGVTRSITLRDANNQIKTIIHPDNIPSIADYFNDTGAYSADLSTLNTTNLTSQVSKSLIVGGTSSDTFDLTVTPFTIKALVALSIGADPSAHVEASTRAYINKNGVFLTELGKATAHAYKDSPGSSTLSIPATTLSITGNATYTLVIVHEVMNQEDPYATNHGEVSGLGTMTTGKIIDRSEIGTNGMIIATSPQNYTYMVGTLFQVRRGNVFMRITANGIEKSTNGTTWTNI